ncbi:hypothetical protein ABT369_12015 [Dactylosporangium sp. NPDC000244]|uniref:hypothetical protein n=1 Tax=Dactylosporangium sp. NPDC000244 TaxID=3154365 RepID=UPI003330DFF1
MADKQIKIDPEGVRAFGASLQSYVDKDIAPTTDFVTYQLQSYGAFGIRSASPAVQDAAVQYWLVMSEAVSFLSTLSHNTGAMARTAKEIVTTYLDADVDSAGFLGAVEGGAAMELTASEQAAYRAKQILNRDDLVEERRDVHDGGA